MPSTQLRAYFWPILLGLILPQIGGSGAQAQSSNLVFESEKLADGLIGLSHFQVVDLDGNGQLDILLPAPDRGQILWLKRVDAQWVQEILYSGLNGVSHLITADFDGDGDLDIIAASFSGDQVLWLDHLSGDGMSWHAEPLDFDLDGPISLRAGDVDLDGDLDLIGAGFFDNDLIWWENQLSELPEGRIARRQLANRRVASGQLANRLVAKGELTPATPPPTETDPPSTNPPDSSPEPTAEPTPAPTPTPTAEGWIRHRIADTLAGVRSIQLADFNGDGRIDIVGVGRYANAIYWYENQGVIDPEAGFEFQRRSVVEDFYYAESLDLKDIDGDGDLDILGVSRFERDLVFFENLNGDGLQWESHKVDGKFDGASFIAGGDLNGDGAQDVVGLSRRDRRMSYWLNLEGTGLDWDEFTLAEDLAAPTHLEILDLDQDGAMDLLLATAEDGALQIYHQRRVSDADGDGFSVEAGDCDDGNGAIYPGAPEICGDGIDQNCDPQDDACSGETPTPIASPTPGGSTPLGTPTPGEGTPGDGTPGDDTGQPTASEQVPTDSTPPNTTTTASTPPMGQSPTPSAPATADQTSTPGSEPSPSSTASESPRDPSGEPTHSRGESPTEMSGSPSDSPSPTALTATESPTMTPAHSTSPEATETAISSTATPVSETDGPGESPTPSISPTAGGGGGGCECHVEGQNADPSRLFSFVLAGLILWPLRRRQRRRGVKKETAIHGKGHLLGLFMGLFMVPQAQAQVVINEVVARPVEGNQDWIELYNLGDETVDLSGYGLRDAQDGQPHPEHIYRFPESTFLAAQGYLLIERDEVDGFDFGLGGEDGVFLVDANDQWIDSTLWQDGDAEEGSAWARIPDGIGDFQSTTQPTPGAANIHSDTPAPDPAAFLFDGTIRTFEMQIDDEDWAWLNQNQTLEIYVPGRFYFGDQVFEDVGIRYKGSTGALYGCFDDENNLICDKLSMKVSFHKFVDGRRFHGLKKLQFHAMENDEAKMRERIGYTLFRDFGVTAPRVNYARLVINDEVFGLYSLIEHIDDIFTKTHFEDGGDGHLYKEVWPIYAEDEPYLDNLETHGGDAPDVSPMVDFAQDIEGSSEEDAYEMLDRWLDLNQQMRFLAVDRAIENQDGIMGWWCFGPWCGNHNFYWYQGLSGEKMWLIPWDLDHAFAAEPWTADIDGWPYWYEPTLTCRPMSLWGPIGFLPPACDDLIYHWGNAAWDDYHEMANLLLDTLFTEAALHDSVDRYFAQISPLIEEDPVIDHAEWVAEVEQFKLDLIILRERLITSLER